MMEAPPRPALEVRQAQLLLHLLVALFHRPATLPEADPPQSPGLLRQIAEGILPLAVGLLFDQQPDRLRQGAAAGVPARGGPDAEPGEPAGELPLGPLPPGAGTPGRVPGPPPLGSVHAQLRHTALRATNSPATSRPRP